METASNVAGWRVWLHSGTAWERCVSMWQIVFPPWFKMRKVYGQRSAPVLTALYLLRPLHLTVRLARALSAHILNGRRFPRVRVRHL